MVLSERQDREASPEVSRAAETSIEPNEKHQRAFDEVASEAFSFGQWLEDNETKKAVENIEKKHLSLTWSNLSVTGVDSRTVLGHNVLSCVNPVELISDARGSAGEITILHDLNGQVRAGEMMLVLGRPGSGCTTFLKTVANKRGSFKRVDGDVFYGNMSAKEAEHYRGLVLYNNEDDVHFPTLTVAQTLGFAVKNRVSRHARENVGVEKHVKEMLDVVPEALGISHAKGTLVGNEFVRGVSGGERKRVSIGEVMAAQGAITCWDNATRGLDASTALEYAQTCRAMADKAKVVAVVTLYQAGNGIFNLFDKVLVLDEGRQIYYGPANMAKAYFEDLGFICPLGANVADFLTSSTVATERRFKPGYEHSAPKTAEELETVYRNSDLAKKMQADILPLAEFEQETNNAKKSLQDDQPKHKSPLQGSYTIGLGHQILACVKRDIEVIMGDKASIGMQQIAALIQSLCSGSLFYNLPDTSAGVFTRSGAIFYPLVFYNLAAMAEVNACFFGRPILDRHRDFSFYRPTAYVIAKMITDIPNIILQVSIFSLIYYFMISLQVDAGKFFTFWVLTIVASLMCTALYRFIGCMFANFDNAAKISGFYSMVMMVYAGFFIPFQTMHVWFRWIWYLNPCGYAYEALLGNEFAGLVLECTGDQLIPNGDAYSGFSNRACTIPGATADGTQIIGEDYLQTAFSFSPAHIWRNFGICIAWWLAFTACTAIAMEIGASGNSSSKSSLIFKRGKDNKSTSKSLRKSADEETQAVPRSGGSSTSSATQICDDDDLRLARNESIFTWDHLSYTVDVPGGKRKLLDDITGWVKPGQLGALMGSSGAGKTTLLDVLAQRKDTGLITGEVLVDGRPLPVSFQRSAGYCEQMDIHEGTSTVKEALIFSARLRQPMDTPDDEKLSYVESIIKLLELEDIEDALIGVPGAGLTVEQRKRLTIGVELAAKPSILLFLDEPTSGLDGQSSFNIIRFLRRLTEAGQAVLCTIHQPSATLFESFDSLLLLAKGGQTVYFGETGENSSILLEYFSRNGAPGGSDSNPAEHIIDVVSGAAGGGRDWHTIWVESPEHTQVVKHLAEIKAEALSKPSTLKTDDNDFATPLWTQLKLVTARQKVALWRNPTYVWNKFFLHVSSALFAGFTFWKLGDSASDLQLRLLSCFNFLFVAIGVIAQLQPLFLHYRDIFEAREKKSKMYSWIAFVTAQLLAEVPYLVICATLYFACWYFTIGLDAKGSTSGQVFFQMILFEFLYTAIGQAIAAISPNPFFASLLNPTIISAFLINFSGVLVPYSQIVTFWKYWMYYLNPYTYLIGGLATQPLYDVDVMCTAKDLTSFAAPNGTTCGEFMAKFFETGYGYLVDPESTTNCEYCAFKTGGEYAKTLNYNERMYGWRDTGITALFCISTYGFVFLMMKLRSKKTKSAKLD